MAGFGLGEGGGFAPQLPMDMGAGMGFPGTGLPPGMGPMGALPGTSPLQPSPMPTTPLQNMYAQAGPLNIVAPAASAMPARPLSQPQPLLPQNTIPSPLQNNIPLPQARPLGVGNPSQFATPGTPPAIPQAAPVPTMGQLLKQNSANPMVQQYGSMVPDQGLPLPTWKQQHPDLYNSSMVPKEIRSIFDTALNPQPPRPPLDIPNQAIPLPMARPAGLGQNSGLGLPPQQQGAVNRQSLPYSLPPQPPPVSTGIQGQANRAAGLTGGITGRTSITALDADPQAQAAIERFQAAFPNVKNAKDQIYHLIAGESGFGRDMVSKGQYAGYFQLGKNEAYGPMGLNKHQFAALPFHEQLNAYTNWAKRADPTGQQLSNIGVFNAASNMKFQSASPNTVVYPAGSNREARANAPTWGRASGMGGAVTVGGIANYYNRQFPGGTQMAANQPRPSGPPPHYTTLPAYGAGNPGGRPMRIPVPLANPPMPLGRPSPSGGGQQQLFADAGVLPAARRPSWNIPDGWSIRLIG